MKPTSTSGGTQAPPELVFDSALEVPEQDLLDRAEFAKAIARSVLTVSADEPFVIGLHGPPGSGKSTVLNFIRHYITHPESLGAGGIAADPAVAVSFQPTWHPDAGLLGAHLFSQLRGALAGAAGAGDALPRAAGALERFSSGLQQPGGTDLFALKRHLAELLRGQDTRIVVIADDLDKLAPATLAAFLNLIAAAGLPRFIFLLSFDREAVTRSLEAARVADPEAVLSKLVQLPFDVPEPDKFTLRQMLSGYISGLFAGAPAELYTEADWEQFFWQGLDQLLAGPREMKRFVNALRSNYSPIKQEVNFVDFAAVQTLRVFAPGMYRFLIANKPMLTGTGGSPELTEKQARMARIEAMKGALEAVPEPRRAPVDHILQCLFPEWETGLSSQRRRIDGRARLDRRVSSADVFDIYFNPNIPAGALTRTEIRSILELAPDPAAFRAKLMKLAAEEGRAGKSRLDAFLEHMQDYTQEEIPIAHIPALLETIFDAGDGFCSKLEREPIPSRRNDFQLIFIVAQLLARLPDEATRADLLKQILPNANAIYTAIRFTLRVDPEGSRDAAGWSVETAKGLRAIVLERLRAAAAEGDLAAVPYLDVVFHVWESWSTAEEPEAFAKQLAEADDGIADLLVGALKPLSPGETRFSSNLDFLNRWTSLDFTELMPKCREWLRVKPEWLTEVRQVAIDAFVAAIGSATIA